VTHKAKIIPFFMTEAAYSGCFEADFGPKFKARKRMVLDLLFAQQPRNHSADSASLKVDFGVDYRFTWLSAILAKRTFRSPLTRGSVEVDKKREFRPDTDPKSD
jgi:hypothetical protein